jgi:hypothetical protein
VGSVLIVGILCSVFMGFGARGAWGKCRARGAWGKCRAQRLGARGVMTRREMEREGGRV